MLSRYYCNIFIIFSYCDLFSCGMHGRINNYLRNNVSTTVKFEGKIVGGTLVNIDAYPFTVQFINMGTLCGGIILNSWTVITAAHCLEGNTNTNFMSIIAGAQYIFDRNADTYDVLSFVIHENYNKEQTFSQDIALLFVTRPIELGPKAKKGILVDHNKWMNTQESNFIVIGWGTSENKGWVASSGLRSAHLQYVMHATCSRLLDGYRLTNDMFCLYGEGKRDTCQGDSGGGVLWNDMLVGLTSHGDGCAKELTPSIYTNLYVMRYWIKKHVYAFIDRFNTNRQY